MNNTALPGDLIGGPSRPTEYINLPHYDCNRPSFDSGHDGAILHDKYDVQMSEWTMESQNIHAYCRGYSI